MDAASKPRHVERVSSEEKTTAVGENVSNTMFATAGEDDGNLNGRSLKPPQYIQRDHRPNVPVAPRSKAKAAQSISSTSNDAAAKQKNSIGFIESFRRKPENSEISSAMVGDHPPKRRKNGDQEINNRRKDSVVSLAEDFNGIASTEPTCDPLAKHADPRVQEQLEKAEHHQTFAVVRPITLSSKEQVTAELKSMLLLKSAIKKESRKSETSKYFITLSDYMKNIRDLHKFLPQHAPSFGETKAGVLTAKLAQDIAKARPSAVKVLQKDTYKRTDDVDIAIEETREELRATDRNDKTRRGELIARSEALHLMADSIDVLSEVVEDQVRENKKG